MKEGALLAQIDPAPFQALLDQAVAQKANDEVTLANARKDLERYKTLFAQDSIQQQTLDTQNGDRRPAQGEHPVRPGADRQRPGAARATRPSARR